MLFTVVSALKEIPSDSTSKAYLLRDAWDDNFRYETQFYLVVFDVDGKKVDVGNVKIGQLGQAERRPAVQAEFEALEPEFFSLGQEQNYYEQINTLDGFLRDSILTGLRDCAKDLAIFEAAEFESVMRSSLLRFVSSDTVRGKFHRLANGNAELTPFKFSYEFPKKIDPPVVLSFDVRPNSNPPTNIYVIIGRNGVGKTTCLRAMTLSLMGEQGEDVGSFLEVEGEEWQFANLVSVTFSAFDPFDPLPEGTIGKGGMRYSYVGLKRPARIKDGEEIPQPTKSSSDLVIDFVEALSNCKSGLRKNRWYDALETLEADPLFEEANISSIKLESEGDTDWRDSAARIFAKLSSGHKIVLLTITRLVELVDEQTLVLLDEPESHLHPPLLSAFVRALSNLLINRNGVAIIASHSPVVLQEVPKTCAWYLSRSGQSVRADRPELETFGENVGVLTREVFGLEVTQSGFHKMIKDAIGENATYDQVVALFGGQIGIEGRAIARGLIAARRASQQGGGEE